MRFGVCAPNVSRIGDEYPLVEIARTAERLGYDSVWVSDHIALPASERRFGHVIEAFVALSFMAAQTARLRLGTSVLVLPQREPLLVAKQAASLHHLSGGRLVLGVGAGWLPAEFAALGVDYGRRGKRADEFIEVLRAAWGPADVVSFRGAEVAFEGILSVPRPDASHPIPIVVGGSSPAALRRAARYGDGWQPDGVTPAELREQAERLLTFSGGRRLPISARIAAAVGRAYEPPEGPGGRYARIEGTPQQVVEAVQAYAAAGLDELLLQFHGPDFLDQVQAFAEDVMPRVGG